MSRKRKRQPSRGVKNVSPEKKYLILKMLLEGQTCKRVSYEAHVDISTVYIARSYFPLFFWKSKED